jgi:uncharacterized protein (TIGR02266 family)
VPAHFRVCPRYPLKMRVAVFREQDRGPREIEAHTENLGFRGAFLRVDPPLPPGTRVRVSIASATTWEPLRIAGEVRWVRDAQPGAAAGMGVAFDPLTEQHALALHRLFGAHGFEED